MIKYALPAAVAALALALPGAAGAQTAPLPQPMVGPQQMQTTPAVGQPMQAAPGYGAAEGYSYPYGQPMTLVPVPVGSVWIAGHYNWDPGSHNYVWVDGEYAQPPHPNAQWVDGHWMQTPTSWVWVDGRWS